MTWSVPNRIGSILLAILGIAYPVLVYFGLSVFSPRLILIVLIAAVLLRAALFLGSGKRVQAITFLLVAAILACAGIASELVAIRFYPVIVSATHTDSGLGRLFYCKWQHCGLDGPLCQYQDMDPL